MSRVYLAWSAVLGLLALAGCRGPTKIGTSCNANGDCNLEGQVCVNKICTKACSRQYGDGGCPVGFLCSVAEGGSSLTCNKALFAVDEQGQPLLMGKSCATSDDACQGTGDPAGDPQCRKAENMGKPGTPVPVDPRAFCTAPCETNAQCPAFMECGQDWDGVKKCLLRQLCSVCDHNDNCNADGGENMGCVPTADGTSRYCAPRCNVQKDCPGSAQAINYVTCQRTTDAAGNEAGYCVHRFGACVGQGEICDPCRADADCEKSGTKCIRNDQTGERMCTRGCRSDSQCAGPRKATCDTEGYGVCTGDPNHDNPGLFSCWPN